MSETAGAGLDSDQRDWLESLKFTRDEKHGVNQPLYDWSCFLMSQSIVGLEEKRKYFIDTFNCDHDLWLSYGVD